MSFCQGHSNGRCYVPPQYTQPQYVPCYPCNY